MSKTASVNLTIYEDLPGQSQWLLTSGRDNIVAVLIALISCMLTSQIHNLDYILNYTLASLPLMMLFLSSYTKWHIKVRSLLCMLIIFVLSINCSFQLVFFISCLLSGILNLHASERVGFFILLQGACLTAIIGFLLTATANLSFWLFNYNEQIQLILLLTFLLPVTVLGRLNLNNFLTNKENEIDLEGLQLSTPYEELCERYYLLSQRILNNEDRYAAEFQEIRFLIDSTEKLIFHGDKIYKLCLPVRVQQLKEKYTRLSSEPVVLDASSSRLNHLTEIEVQMKYFEETIAFENKLFDQIETILLIFERIEVSLLRSETAKISLSSLELTKTNCEIQQSLDALRDNAEGLIDLGH